jgi:hypothetical protein
MNVRRWLLLLVIIFLMPMAKSQEDKFKALFMYNFTKYLEWPTAKQKGEFIIGVYGSSPIITELNVIAEKRKVGAQQIVIKKVIEISELPACHIVYLPENRSDKAKEVFEMCKTKGVVLITDKQGLAKTFSGINYVTVDGKQNFEINRKHLESEGVKINSALLSLGINID